jgi:hypothetical protein
VINRDGLVNAPPKAVATAAFKLLTVLQDEPPHIQAAGMAVVFLLFTEHHRANAQDVMAAASNLLAFDRGAANKQDAFGALRDYLRYEIKRG